MVSVDGREMNVRTDKSVAITAVVAGRSASSSCTHEAVGVAHPDQQSESRAGDSTGDSDRS